jgi:hypothetical protein
MASRLLAECRFGAEVGAERTRGSGDGVVLVHLPEALFDFFASKRNVYSTNLQVFNVRQETARLDPREQGAGTHDKDRE